MQFRVLSGRRLDGQQFPGPVRPILDHQVGGGNVAVRRRGPHPGPGDLQVVRRLQRCHVHGDLEALFVLDMGEGHHGRAVGHAVPQCAGDRDHVAADAVGAGVPEVAGRWFQRVGDRPVPVAVHAVAHGTAVPGIQRLPILHELLGYFVEADRSWRDRACDQLVHERTGHGFFVIRIHLRVRRTASEVAEHQSAEDQYAAADS